MKISCFFNESFEKEYLEGKLTDYDVEYFPSPIQNAENFKSEAEILTIFVKSKVGKEELDRMPSLKFIATRSTGFDHIDLEETTKRGIIVSNVPAYGQNTVAEHAFALLLSLSRKIYPSYKRVKEEGSFSQDGLRGFDLKDKTMGIVGTGHIGRHAIRMARGFDMKVIAYDINHDDAFAKEMGFTYVSFDELLKQSDVVSLHVPYNEHTHHLINKENITLFKNGSYLINTSRGAVVETDALVLGLTKGILSGAGLDVLEEEGPMFDHEVIFASDKHPEAETLKTLFANHYLVEHPSVIVTPHNAFNTEEAIIRILDITIENIQAYSQGKPTNVVEKKG